MVSLRQIQRKATREKERNQELRRLQDEARKEEGQRLTQRLKELERDKNLMLVGGRGGALLREQSCGKGRGLCPGLVAFNPLLPRPPCSKRVSSPVTSSSDCWQFFLPRRIRGYLWSPASGPQSLQRLHLQRRPYAPRSPSKVRDRWRGTSGISPPGTLQCMSLVLCDPWRPTASLVHARLGPGAFSLITLTSCGVTVTAFSCPPPVPWGLLSQDPFLSCSMTCRA